MSVPHSVLELIERFNRNRTAYRSEQYNEARLRIEFLNPFFEALGWDVNNRQGYAEAYKDVIYEDAIKIGGATKAPDYCFRIGGTRKFFVEAKKPGVNLKDAGEPAFQLRRYAWSAKLPLSILTDFEEFAIYDCRVKPDRDDKAATARIKYFTYTDYLQQWEEIASIFSHEAILKGSFDTYAEATRGKRGTAEVDAAFLQEIESWREMLAHHLAFRNKSLTQRELNYAVQMTIDRIIFLRICEDRGIEDYERLKALLKGTNVYDRLCKLFQEADDRYNSGLFHFQKEKDIPEPPDTLTPNLVIDDKPLKDIMKRLYYPDSPYEFSALPADVLGQVYEQFLGKVIRLTPSHQVTVEEKLEVRKAGGVYYTPTFIVNYIVQHTLGKLLEGKKPGVKGSASKIKIVDPACGSGSFLIGAYQYLLDWHRDRYVEAGPEKHRKELYQGPGGLWLLTTQEKKRILLNSIYGVDIDPQAVEVTKLSLLLKVLEGESSQSLNSQLRLFHERALPDLDRNIKCGNSLIDPSFYEVQQMNLLDEEEQYRINAFDWVSAFPQVFSSDDPGFDAVIGNPPYIFTRNRGIDERQKKYFYDHYKHQSSQLNTFGLFIERGNTLLSEHGMLGFITPNNWLTIDTFAPLRAFILQASSGVKIVNILDKVFAAANVDTAIVLLEKGKPTNLTISEMSGRTEVFSQQVELTSIKPPTYIIHISLLKDSRSQHLLQKIDLCSQPLDKFCTVSTGLKVYQTGKGKPPQTDYEKEHRVFHATTQRDSTYERYLDGVDVRRYFLGWSGEYLSYGDWLAEPRKSVPFVGERLLVRQIPAKPPYLVHSVFTNEPFYNDINSMVVFSPVGGIALKYLLGLINSLLLSVWFRATFDKLQRNIFPQFKVKELASFPIRPINFSDPADRARHDRMVSLVEQMLSLHKRLAEAKLPHDKEVLQQQIDVTDQQIDRLVYELYGLTGEEIKMVEEIQQV